VEDCRVMYECLYHRDGNFDDYGDMSEEDKPEIMESFVLVTPMPIKSCEMVFLCNCGDPYKNYACVHSGLFSMLWNLEMTFLRSRIARRRILCSKKWIPSVLFPREARVLLDTVISRRTVRREKGYMCIIVHVCGVGLLTGWTHLHSVQKTSASQPLLLVMEKAGGKRARPASPSANPSQRQTLSKQRI
jgi:hypothetical protein